MTSIVGVQHDVAMPRQVVVFPRHALARKIRVRIDVAVVEHEDRKRTLAIRDVHDTGDGQSVTAVGDDVALVRAVVREQPTHLQVTTVVLLVDQRLHRYRMRLGCLSRLRRWGGARPEGLQTMPLSASTRGSDLSDVACPLGSMVGSLALQATMSSATGSTPSAFM